MNNNIEIWKDVQGYEGIYQVSNLGRVKSLHKNTKILMPRLNNRRYQYVMFFKDKKYKHFLVHRLVAQAFIPNPNKLLQVNHIDENKENNCISNLIKVWPSIREASRKGFDRSSISYHIKNKKPYKGYIWKLMK